LRKYKNKNSLIVVLFLIISFINPVLNQDSNLYAQKDSLELYFRNPYQEKLTLRFDFINNLVVLPVRINSSDTLRFILDTGLNTALITELSVGDSLLLNYSHKIKVQGIGEGDAIEALHSVGNFINISGIVGFNQPIYVLLENNLNLSSHLGAWIHGIMGYKIFKNFIVEINYEQELVTFYNPKKYTYKRMGKKAVTIPLSIENTKPFITTTITLEDGTVIPVKLLIDTGVNFSLWLDTESDDRIKLPKGAKNAFLGSGISGEVYGKIGRISKIDIGKHELLNLVASFPDSASIGKVRQIDERNGSIGSEVFRRFRVIIDYSNELITFIPNNRFLESFKYDMSGMKLIAPYPGLPLFEISEILESSPADIAGLRVGDHLVSINNIKASKYSLSEIRNILQHREGKKIRITVSRNGEILKTQFLLVRLI